MKSCLIVDDLELVRRVLSTISQKLGFSVREADSADAALLACRQVMPDLILLDWEMAGLPAHEFILALRSRRRGGHPIVIYCTTNSDAPTIARMMASGANDFLLKPFELEDLAERLRVHGLIERGHEWSTVSGPSVRRD